MSLVLEFTNEMILTTGKVGWVMAWGIFCCFLFTCENNFLGLVLGVVSPQSWFWNKVGKYLRDRFKGIDFGDLVWGRLAASTN